jgi:hypothetical protein
MSDRADPAGRARSRLRKAVARGMSSAWNDHLGKGASLAES